MASERRTLTAVISGAGGGGIGTAIARQLLKDSFFVVTIERTAEAAQYVAQLTSSGLISSVIGDVGQESTSERLATHIRSLGRTCDVLVHNAARGAPFRKIEDISEKEFRQDVDDILLGGFFLTKHLYKMSSDAFASRIIFISSAAAVRGSWGRGPSYAASKAALLGLTKHLALQLAGHGTTVNAVTPYQTLSPRVLRGGRRSPASIESAAKRGIPLGRVASPEDVAHVVAFLASSKSAYLTGQVIELDGGRSLAPFWTKPGLGL